MITRVQISSVHETLQGAIEEMDAKCLEILNLVGGNPWLALDDDFVKKAVDHQLVEAGREEGFRYFGNRTMIFTGPILPGINRVPPFHDGFSPQGGNNEET